MFSGCLCFPLTRKNRNHFEIRTILHLPDIGKKNEGNSRKKLFKPTTRFYYGEGELEEEPFVWSYTNKLYCYVDVPAFQNGPANFEQNINLEKIYRNGGSIRVRDTFKTPIERSHSHTNFGENDSELPGCFRSKSTSVLHKLSPNSLDRQDGAFPYLNRTKSSEGRVSYSSDQIGFADARLRPRLGSSAFDAALPRVGNNPESRQTEQTVRLPDDKRAQLDAGDDWDDENNTESVSSSSTLTPCSVFSRPAFPPPYPARQATADGVSRRPYVDHWVEQTSAQRSKEGRFQKFDYRFPPSWNKNVGVRSLPDKAMKSRGFQANERQHAYNPSCYSMPQSKPGVNYNLHDTDEYNGGDDWYSIDGIDRTEYMAEINRRRSRTSFLESIGRNSKGSSTNSGRNASLVALRGKNLLNPFNCLADNTDEYGNLQKKPKHRGAKNFAARTKMLKSRSMNDLRSGNGSNPPDILNGVTDPYGLIPGKRGALSDRGGARSSTGSSVVSSDVNDSVDETDSDVHFHRENEDCPLCKQLNIRTTGYRSAYMVVRYKKPPSAVTNSDDR